MNNSPLGQYAPRVAAIVSVGVIGTYVVALVLANKLGLTTTDLAPLHDLAILAIGAVFATAVAVNGWKQPMQSAHDRIDRLEAGTGINTHPNAETAEPEGIIG